MKLLMKKFIAQPRYHEEITRRCLIYIDRFYEHHHFEKQTYPFYIFKKHLSPIILVGLFIEWINPQTKGKLLTFSIVTTTGNQLLSKIHNNPKLKESRMPVILHEELADKWLEKIAGTKYLRTYSTISRRGIGCLYRGQITRQGLVR